LLVAAAAVQAAVLFALPLSSPEPTAAEVQVGLLSYLVPPVLIVLECAVSQVALVLAGVLEWCTSFEGPEQLSHQQFYPPSRWNLVTEPAIQVY